MEYMDYKEALKLVKKELNSSKFNSEGGGIKRFCEIHEINYTSASETLSGNKRYPGILSKLLIALEYKVEYKKVFQIETLTHS